MLAQHKKLMSKRNEVREGSNRGNAREMETTHNITRWLQQRNRTSDTISYVQQSRCSDDVPIGVDPVMRYGRGHPQHRFLVGKILGQQHDQRQTVRTGLEEYVVLGVLANLVHTENIPVRQSSGPFPRKYLSLKTFKVFICIFRSSDTVQYPLGNINPNAEEKSLVFDSRVTFSAANVTAKNYL